MSLISLPALQDAEKQRNAKKITISRISKGVEKDVKKIPYKRLISRLYSVLNGRGVGA